MIIITIDNNMNIVHYSLGFPPFRTGGMNKFVYDLMLCQLKQGNNISLLWPGRFNVFNKDTKIINSINNGIYSYEIVNPNPVSYDEGINEVKNFIEEGNIETYIKLFEDIKPDVLHLHTLMGIHKSMVLAAKQLGIKVIYSAHNFFSICPIVTLFNGKQCCDKANEYIDCPLCNRNAISVNKLKLLQSPLYMFFKDNYIFRLLRKRHRNRFLENNNDNKVVTKNNSDDYKVLREYYDSILELVNVFHFNSNLTKDVFEKHMSIGNSTVIGLSHFDIKDNRKIKQFNNCLRITYLGTQSKSKGYYYLINVLDKLSKEKDIRLNICFDPDSRRDYINIVKYKDYSSLKNIFDITDVLIVPSIGYDTFGFVTAEAISYGVPVMISNHVGATDIVNSDCAILFDINDENDLYEKLKNLNNKQLADMNRYICETDIIINTIEDVSNDIMIKCYLD